MVKLYSTLGSRGAKKSTSLAISSLGLTAWFFLELYQRSCAYEPSPVVWLNRSSNQKFGCGVAAMYPPREFAVTVPLRMKNEVLLGTGKPTRSPAMATAESSEAPFATGLGASVALPRRMV